MLRQLRRRAIGEAMMGDISVRSTSSNVAALNYGAGPRNSRQFPTPSTAPIEHFGQRLQDDSGSAEVAGGGISRKNSLLIPFEMGIRKVRGVGTTASTVRLRLEAEQVELRPRVVVNLAALAGRQDFARRGPVLAVSWTWCAGYRRIPVFQAVRQARPAGPTSRRTARFRRRAARRPAHRSGS